MTSIDSFGARGTLDVGSESYEIFRIAAVEGSARLPFTHKVLLENLLRTEDGANVTHDTIASLGAWDPSAEPSEEIQFTPARVVMQDFTGVPVVVDLATMREAVIDLGGDPAKIEPLAPAELVIDHSVIADFFGTPDAEEKNVELEYERNRERYQFLRWGQGAFDEFKVVPPGTGIVHQVNLEALARVVMARGGQAYPDTVVGTDSHTTMINGLGVLGWGVGGIEAEAAMLGQPVSMLIPRVVGFKLTGELPAGRHRDRPRAHDHRDAAPARRGRQVRRVLRRRRRRGAAGQPRHDRQHEPGVRLDGGHLPDRRRHARLPAAHRPLRAADRAGRGVRQGAGHVARPGARAGVLGVPRARRLHGGAVARRAEAPAGPRAAERVQGVVRGGPRLVHARARRVVETTINGSPVEIGHGIVAIAAITSCTNTSNPYVMMGAGLLAKKAVERGLSRKPWVKTTLGPGSKVVTDYYEKAGLTPYLDKLGFNVVGYGCTVCIGNSGPLIPQVSAAVNDADLAVVSVLSGNRNFEGRISPDVKMNYLASPPLVVAYALAGTMDIDLATEPLGFDEAGNGVFLADIWPTMEEIQSVIDSSVSAEMFQSRNADVFTGDERWQSLSTPDGDIFEWDAKSTYVRKPPYFDGMEIEPKPVLDITGARVLLKLGDSVTTDHISPAGNIKADSPAGAYLMEHGVDKADFNSYGSRRGNHEVMIRGTFANIRLRNLMLKDVEGGFTVDFTTPDDMTVPVYDAAMAYAAHHTPLVILAGKEYGSGSSRDWAAKGTALLGVRAVIAESYERIHRSNLIGMGVLPLQFQPGMSADALGLQGDEVFTIHGITALNDGVTPREVDVEAVAADGRTVEFTAIVRIDTPGEADYYRHGGILQYVLRSLL